MKSGLAAMYAYTHTLYTICITSGMPCQVQVPASNVTGTGPWFSTITVASSPLPSQTRASTIDRSLSVRPGVSSRRVGLENPWTWIRAIFRCLGWILMAETRNTIPSGLCILEKSLPAPPHRVSGKCWSWSRAWGR